MMSRDFTKWNYDTLLDLVEGPTFESKTFGRSYQRLEIRQAFDVFLPSF